MQFWLVHAMPFCVLRIFHVFVNLDINITVPAFSNVKNYGSYIQYQAPVLSGPYFAITLQFKIANSSGACASSLLMFSGQV